jgi:hypothetical protein
MAISMSLTEFKQVITDVGAEIKNGSNYVSGSLGYQSRPVLLRWLIST